MKKKTLLIILGILLVLFVLYFFGTGLHKNTTVFIEDFSVSEDGTALTLKTADASSAGYIRKLAVKSNEDGVMKLDAYAAFGGFNGTVGAQNTFVLQVDKDVRTIALCRGNGSYEEVLGKGEDGLWKRLP